MGTATDQAPFIERATQSVPAVAAATTDGNVVGRAPFKGVVRSVTYTPKVAIAGVNTNTRRVRVFNRRQDGSGATVVADLQFNAGVNATAFDERDIPLTATVADRDVAEGDILEFRSESVGTGLADPGGVVAIEFQRD
jgi:hypothetical protein